MVKLLVNNFIENKNLQKFLDELKKNFVIRSVYFCVNSDEKSNKKINAAKKAFGQNILGDEFVIACEDETLFGACDEGIIFTNKGMHIKNYKVKTFIKYQDMHEILPSKKDKYYINIDGIEIRTIMVGEAQISLFCKMIKFLVGNLG